MQNVNTNANVTKRRANLTPFFKLRKYIVLKTNDRVVRLSTLQQQ